MPQIPTLSNQTSLRGLPSVRAQERPRDGLQVLARGVADVGAILNKVRQEETLRADRAAVTEADRMLGETENSLLFDPQAGAYTRRGKNAFNLPQQVLPEYDKAAAKIEQGLATDRQKLVFREALNERRVRIERDLNQHEHQERNNYYDQTDEAAISTSVQTATNYAYRPDRVDAELATQRSVINGLASRKGWDETQKSMAMMKAETQTHEAVVSRMLLDNKFDAAGAYLAQKAPRMLDSSVEHLQRRIILEEEQGFARMERMQRRASEEIVKEGDKLLSGGNLTPDWIERNRKVLSQEDYRYFLRKLSGGDDESKPADVITYADIRDRAGRGEDVREEARQALLRGQIRTSDYNNIVGEVETGRPNWYKRGSQFISTSAAVSDLNPDPAAAQKKAQMLDDWDMWARENPQAKDTEAQAAYRRIVEEYAIVDTSNMALTKRAPRFLVGSRNTPDIDATEAETVRAFEEGKIDQREFERQAQLISEWRRVFDAAPKKPTPK